MKLAFLLVVLFTAWLVNPVKDSYGTVPVSPYYEVLSDTLKPINQKGEFLIVDTSLVFDPETYEEMVKIKTYYVPLKEYNAIQRKNKRKARRRSRKKLIEVRDTCIVFNPETYEEQVSISTRKFTKKEYKQWLKSQKNQ